MLRALNQYRHSTLLEILLSSTAMGSGKTEATIRQLIRLIRDGESCILAQPTIELSKQTLRSISAIDPNINVVLINGETCPGGSVYQLSEHLRQPPDHPHLVVTTWESFVRLPRIFNREKFHLKIDEVPKAFKSFSAQLPRNHSRLTEAMEIIPQGASYGEITVTDKGSLRRIAENRNKDIVDAIFQPCATSILDSKFKSFVNLEQHQGLLRGNVDEPFLRTFSLLMPDVFTGFRSVSILGARANESMLLKWFGRCGVKFKDDEEILSSLRYREQPNGDLIDFYYLSETNWSLYTQEQYPELRGIFVDGAMKCIGDRPFCWLDNVGFEADSPFGMHTNGLKLPHVSHGRNDFQHLDNLVVLTAFNLPPPESLFLEGVAGISRAEQKAAHDYHNTMQTIGRISVRDPNNRNRKMVILPDRQNAEWQSQVFVGSRVQSLKLDHRKPKKPGRPRQYEDSTERQRAKRLRAQQEQDKLVDKFDLGAERILEAGFHMSCHNISYKSLRENVTTYQGSIVNSTFEGMSFPLTMNSLDFGIYMSGLHKKNYATKGDNQLIMPGLCVQIPNVDTNRGIENALFGRHIYLDIDGGNLKYLRLSQIFPHIEMIVYNSYNHTAQVPRYRAVFLTDGLVSPTIYKVLWRQIVQVIENSGYQNRNSYRPKGERKLHGIDNKPNVVNLFYLPCQPKEGKGFYFHYSKNRRPLCVGDWIENAIPTRFDDDQSEDRITVIDAVTEISNGNKIIEAALSRYRVFINSIDPETGRLGSSNKALFVFNQKLRRSGIDLYERDIVLTQAANESRSPQARMKDKERYMNRR